MWGATPADWQRLSDYGLLPDLLPVVSNPEAKISPGSTLRSLGKVPSLYGPTGEVTGISGWTALSAKPIHLKTWSENPDYGICIQTRNVRALDVDIPDPDAARVIRTFIEKWFTDAKIPLPCERTRSNSGKFLVFFRLKGDCFYRKIKTEAGIIEFLGHGKQFIAEGTHESGERYQTDYRNGIVELPPEKFEDLWAQLVDAFATQETRLSASRDRTADLDIDDPVPELLAPLGTGPLGQIYIECPFKDEHTTESSDSATCYFPAGVGGYQQGHFHCFHAHCSDRSDADFLAALGLYEKLYDFDEIPSQPIAKPSQPIAKPAEPFTLPPGLIKDTVDWIVDSSIKPQPELALLNVLAFAGAVFGRRYALDLYDTRTNLYLVGVAGTGSGKDHSRKQIKRLSEAAGLTNFIGGDDLVSGQGLHMALQRQPSHLMMLDEFGMLLHAIANKNAPHYLAVTSKILTQLYSSSGTYYMGGTYADPKREPIRINCPNLCLYGTTTRIKYEEVLTEEAALSGELNRFIVLPAEIEIPERKTPAHLVPLEDLVKKWSLFSPAITALTSDDDIIKVLSHTVFDRLVALGVHEDKQMRLGTPESALYGRYRENVIKIAMLFALSRDADHPVLTDLDLDIGVKMVDKSLHFMQLILKNSSDRSNTQDFLTLCDRILSLLKGTGTMGATKRELSRQIRSATPAGLQNALQKLIETGEIAPQTITTGGRSKTVYVINGLPNK